MVKSSTKLSIPVKVLMRYTIGTNTTTTESERGLCQDQPEQTGQGTRRHQEEGREATKTVDQQGVDLYAHPFVTSICCSTNTNLALTALERHVDVCRLRWPHLRTPTSHLRPLLVDRPGIDSDWTLKHTLLAREGGVSYGICRRSRGARRTRLAKIPQE